MKSLLRIIVVILLATNRVAAQSDEIVPGDNLWKTLLLIEEICAVSNMATSAI
jgi:hypothetical protein